jgi:hypothetical protein
MRTSTTAADSFLHQVHQSMSRVNAENRNGNWVLPILRGRKGGRISITQSYYQVTHDRCETNYSVTL